MSHRRAASLAGIPGHCWVHLPSQVYHGYVSNVRVLPTLHSGLQGSTSTTVGIADKCRYPRTLRLYMFSSALHSSS